MLLRAVDDLVAFATEKNQAVPLACAAPEDRETLEALRLALDAGIARPIAVGNVNRIREIAATWRISLEGFELHDVSDPSQVPARATELVHEGRARILMKGHVTSRELIRAALSHNAGLRGGVLSHVAVFSNVPLGKLLICTDAGVNIRPTLSQKIEIVKNAAEVMRRLGVTRPKVAMLAAIEKVELLTMPATLDAKLVERIAAAGQLGDVDVQGPLALDDAISPDAARAKELAGPVVGVADIVVAPEIETGNVLCKALGYLAGQVYAGIVWGASAPIVVSGRGDSARGKFLSIALAAAILDEKP